MAKEYKLPDGTYTKDVNKMVKEWEEFTKPFTEIGLGVMGFDPHILFKAEGKHVGGASSSFSMPMWAARLIREGLTKEKPND